MKTSLFTFFCTLLLSQMVLAQGVPSAKDDEIMQEGLRLYRSEMASWHGSDLFLAKLPGKRDFMGGYLSYQDGDSMKCIFYSKEDKPNTIAIITFDSTLDPDKATFEEHVRPLNAVEQEYFLIRKATYERMAKDAMFLSYPNTGLNVIPLVDNGNKRVYILTATESEGQVLFGNDYFLTFDKKNKIKSAKKLHQSLLSMPSGSQEDTTGNRIKATMHTHVPESGDHITPTDVCTLLLYQKYTTWKQHYVFTPKNVSIWDCDKKQLVTLSKEAWDKINDHQKQLEETR